MQEDEKQKVIKNEKQLPKVYFGLHMVEGIAEYSEPGKDAFRILVNEQTIKEMDPTFQGKPLYVGHPDEINLKKLRETADGFVIRSFFNKSDGRHWAEFIVVSDAGHEAIRNGWKLSNAYIPKSMSTGGLWHGAEYLKQVTNAEYEHLAIVQNPRYEESIILTPEDFKDYNSEKELELTRLANSKGESSMFQFFKKSKVENSADLETHVVILPKSKKEFTLSELITQMDTIQNMHGYANGDHMVKVGEEEMSVNSLIEKYAAASKKMNDAQDEKKEPELANDAQDEKKEPELENAEDKEKAEKEKKENEDKMAKDAEAKKNALEADKVKKKENYEKLANAAGKFVPRKEEATFELSSEKVARGKERYGSATK